MERQNKITLSDSSTAPALQRGLRVLDYLQGGDQTLEDIAGALQAPKSSLLRILETLMEWKYVDRDIRTKRFKLKVSIQPIVTSNQAWDLRLNKQLQACCQLTQCSVEWYHPHLEFAEITNRAEPKDSPIHIRAQLGFQRHYWGELDAVARIALKGLKLNIDDTKNYWVYREGEHEPYRANQVQKVLAKIDNLMTYDLQYNKNGIRRLAKGILDAEQNFVGILAIPQHYLPKADTALTAILEILQNSAQDLESFFKEQQYPHLG